MFVGRDDEDGRRAGAARARRSACGGSAATSHGGMTSWRQEKRADRAGRAAAARGAARAAEPTLQILDVRERAEWDAGHIPGSAFTPWHDIDALPDGLDPQRPIAVVCASGQRGGDRREPRPARAARAR